MSSSQPAPRWPGPAAFTTLIAICLALLSFAARLVPILRGGGLTGLGNYDDGVYFSAGTALLHGRLPYRDFLFLHPPGVIVLLAPFGLFGMAGHDAAGLAAARLGWVLLGVCNTLLVAHILRPGGLRAVLIGALFYATAFPAIYIEWTPLLEGPAQTCVLGAVALLNRDVRAPGRFRLTATAAGVLLGFSATLKIWGVVAICTVLAWYVLRRLWRDAAAIAVGAAGAAVAVCLPFFAAAPGRMWQMVVVYQLGRDRTAGNPWRRLSAIIGLGLHTRFAGLGLPLIAAVLIVLAVLAAAAVWVPWARLCVLLTVSLTVLLMTGPSWFLHYPGLATGPLAVALGAGVGVAIDRVGHRWRWATVVATGLVAVALAIAAAPLLTLRLGKPFPGSELRAAISARQPPAACVTADDPTALIALNVLTRDLDRGCTFVADLGGYSYQFAAERGRWTPRVRDDRWQAMYLRYLWSGDLCLSYHYTALRALDESTLSTISSWPVVVESGRYVVRIPSRGS